MLEVKPMSLEVIDRYEEILQNLGSDLPETISKMREDVIEFAGKIDKRTLLTLEELK